MDTLFSDFNADAGILTTDSPRCVSTPDPTTIQFHVPDTITGSSKASTALRGSIGKLSSVHFPVLIQGETGSGKEVVARALHDTGSFRKQPFIAINCGAITDSLIISELFGHTRESFTGANNNKAGIFSSVGRGTVFLDEIEAASPFLQSAILRVVENREFLPVGASHPVKFAGRIVSASNADLLYLTRQGTFRKDLYYRLSVFQITVPPLRDRAEDIPELVNFYLSAHAAQFEKKPLFTSDAMNTLCDYRWPGNIRELQNVIMRCILETEEQLIDSQVVRNIIYPEDEISDNHCIESAFVLRDIEKSTVIKALHQCSYNKAKTAKLLGISRSTLYSILNKYDISPSILTLA